VSSDEGRHLPVPISHTALMMRELPASTVLVEADGVRLGGELRRLRGWRARYSLTLGNDSPLHLMVTLRARRGDIERRIPPGEFWIDPHASADLTIDVPNHVAYSGGSLVVRLVNAQIHEMVAPLPGPAGILGAIAGAVVAGGVAAAFIFAQPHIDVFAVPPIGVANSLLHVPYRAGGVGTASFSLIDDRGVTLKSGPLIKNAGTLAFMLPQSQRTQSYILKLSDVGPLGSTERAEPVTALPEPADPTSSASALIDSLAIDSWQIPDGGTVTVRYRTSAKTGVVEVKDAQNTVWAQSKISKDGVSELRIPKFGHDKELRVALAVTLGDEHASSSIGMQVLASPKRTAPPPATSAAANVAFLPGGAASQQQDPVAQSTSATPPPSRPLVTYQSDTGYTVHATIAPGATNVRIALETTDGQTLASEYVPDGATTATIDAPPGTHGRIALIATYDRGQGQESTVKSINIP
jgi:hypothetical protein